MLIPLATQAMGLQDHPLFLKAKVQPRQAALQTFLVHGQPGVKGSLATWFHRLEQHVVRAISVLWWQREVVLLASYHGRRPDRALLLLLLLLPLVLKDPLLPHLFLMVDLLPILLLELLGEGGLTFSQLASPILLLAYEAFVPLRSGRVRGSAAVVGRRRRHTGRNRGGRRQLLDVLLSVRIRRWPLWPSVRRNGHRGGSRDRRLGHYAVLVPGEAQVESLQILVDGILGQDPSVLELLPQHGQRLASVPSGVVRRILVIEAILRA
mmetsp:Transcript_24151/g.48026  ORF Transcript_24151/g.48026 Transcript_24151/m.48026 type:complete len:266 (-) Transcript_24151:626-1423(-)